MNKPLVSVIIPTYGRSDLIKRSIESVLNQTYSNIELIVVDDNGEGTPDQLLTKEQIKEYSSINYIVHKNNQNGAIARNTGIEASKGDYICFLDDDDYFMPEKIELQMKRISGTNYGACLCSHIKHDEEANKETQTIVKLSENYLDDLLYYKVDACSGSTLLIKKNICKQVGGFNPNLHRRQDYNFLFKVAVVTEIVSIDYFGCVIRKHFNMGILTNYKIMKENYLYFYNELKKTISSLPKKTQKKYLQASNYGFMKECLHCKFFIHSIIWFYKSGCILKTFSKMLGDFFNYKKRISFQDKK